MKKTGKPSSGKGKSAPKKRAAKTSSGDKKRDRGVTPEMILGGTILVGQAGGKAVGRAATETYGWIKDHVTGWIKPKKKAAKKPAKKKSKKR